jgi:hypothetical protein
MQEEKKHKKGQGIALGIAIGLPLGIPIGLAMGNLAIGPAIGLALGAGIGLAMESSYRKRDEVETPDISRKRKIQRLVISGILAMLVLILIVLYIISKTSS